MGKTAPCTGLCYTVLVVLLSCCSGDKDSGKDNPDINVKDNPDIYLDVPHLIQKYGYPVEIHHVTTDDGYILELHRIPNHGRGVPSKMGQWSNNYLSEGRIPVFMQHGLMSSSASWVLGPKHRAPAYVMADAGYDVWLGNARGNRYSKNHTHISPKSSKFWDFSWDEIAEHDIPAVIDYILQTTKYSQLYYIGHSMGTTVFFAGMSTHPEYNAKIRAMFALAPVAKVKDMKSPIAYLAPFVDDVQILLNLLGDYEFLPYNPEWVKWTEYLCTHFHYEKLMCRNVLFFLCGFDAQQFNMTWLPVILSHGAEGTSTKTLVHFAQEVNSGNFEHFDYGKEENLIHYGQMTPPKYNLANVTAPVTLMWSENDWLADPRDVAYLASQLPNLVLNIKVPLPDFNHLDFIWGIDAYDLIYQRILIHMLYF